MDKPGRALCSRDLLELLRKQLIDEALDFIAVAISHWHALGVSAALMRLARKFGPRRGVVILRPHPKDGLVIKPLDIIDLGQHRIDYLIEEEWTHRDEAIALASEIRAAIHAVLGRRTDTLSGPPLVAITPLAPDPLVYGLLPVLQAKCRPLHFLCVDEGTGTYASSSVWSLVRRLDDQVGRVRNDFHWRGFIDPATLASAEQLVTVERYFLFEKTEGGVIPNPIPASDYRAVIEAGSASRDIPLPEGNKALLVGQPFSEYGLLSKETEKSALVSLVALLNANGYTIVVKPHPREGMEKYKDLPSTTPVVTLPQDFPAEFVLTRLSCNDLVLGFTSTALVTATCLYGLAAYSANSFLTSTGKLEPLLAMSVREFSEMWRHLVPDIEHMFAEQGRSGELTAEGSAERRDGRKVTRSVESLIDSRRQSVVHTGLGEPKVSIIMPVLNRLELTCKCLDAIRHSINCTEYEIIVIDNGSSDATPQELIRRQANRELRAVLNEDNRGFGPACNQGARAARGQYLVFLNNDTIPQPGWLEALVDAAERLPFAGAVGAKLIYPDGRLQEAGGIVFSDGSAWNYGRGDDPGNPRFNFIREVDYCSAAVLLVRTELFRQLGGFDPRFSPAYYEDTDLCFRIRAAGYRVYYQPEAVVVHVEGATAGTDAGQGFKRYQLANRRKFVEKWHGALQQQYPPLSRWVRRGSDRAPGKRILVVDPFLPMYDRSSGSRRLFEIVRILVKQGHAVTFIARNGLNQEAYAKLLQQIGVEVYSTDPEKMEALGYSVRAPRIDLAELLVETRYDVAWLSFYEIAEQYLPDIRRLSPSTKIYIDTVDVHFVREQREADLFRSNALRIHANKTKEREIAIYRRADALIAVSDEDRKHILVELPDKPIYVVPNIHEVVPEVPPFGGRTGLLFVGNFRHRPNVDAAIYLVEEILPRVRQKIPFVQVTIVGDSPPPEVRRLACDGVVVTGYVPDTGPYLRVHRVSVAPLRYGAGLKGKIGEALAAGLPVITTSVGVEGMNIGPEDEILLVANTPEEFADAVVRVYSDEKLWQRLSENGQRYIRTHYSPDVVAKQIELVVNAGTELSPSHPIRRVPYVGTVRKYGTKDPLLSIIVPVWGDAHATMRCLRALTTHTREPFELIIVDNACDGETRTVIERTAAEFPNNVVLISNPDNYGYPRACNQGIQKANGQYLVVMNNDVVVTPKWAARLMTHLMSRPDLGAIGPRTNFAVGSQRVDAVPYDEETLDEWAEEWHRQHCGSVRLTFRLVGFLLMMKRELVDYIGGFDPLFGIGNFEDDDFCLRALLAGYKLAIADDVFVHHYGHKAFQRHPSEYMALMETNKRLFAAKWNIRFQGGGYDPLEVLKRKKDSLAELYVPVAFESIFSPDIRPMDVGTQASRRFLCIPDPSDLGGSWVKCVRNYLTAFGPHQDAALIVRVEPTEPGWLAHVVGAIKEVAHEIGVPIEQRDDVIVEGRRVHSLDRGRLYRAATCFIPLPGVRRESLTREAEACGLTVLGREL